MPRPTFEPYKGPYKDGRPRANQNPITKREGTKRGKAKTLTAVDTIRGKAPDTGLLANVVAIDEDKPLTDMQRAFAKEWASGESIATATLRAGYSQEVIGYRMAKMPNILKLYHEEKRQYEAVSQMTRKRVMEGFIEAIEMAKLMAEPMTMISGWREVGKMCGYYEPTKIAVDVNVKGDLTVRQLTSMTDAELLKLINGAPEQAAPMLE